MSTEKQIIANRLNSEGAGVKTEEGKQVVRHNAFKHGMTAQSLLSGFNTIDETAQQYNYFVDGLRASFKPRNFFEESLIEQMAKAQLKLKRFDVLEVALYEEKPDFMTDTTGLRISNVGTGLELMLKYKHSIEGQYYRAVESLYRSRQWSQMDLFGKAGTHD
jgi:hypothetical protein